MRNEAARIALENECDYLMFIDDDIVVEPNTLETLINRNADVVAAETYIRGGEFAPMFFKETPDGGLTAYWDFENHVLPDGTLPVDALGFSCVLINCALLKKVTTPYFVTGQSFTEDVYFCRKAVLEAQKNNASAPKIIIDTHVKVGHQCTPEFVSGYNVKLMRKYAKGQELAHNPDRGKDYAELVENLFNES